MSRKLLKLFIYSICFVCGYSASSLAQLGPESDDIKAEPKYDYSAGSNLQDNINSLATGVVAPTDDAEENLDDNGDLQKVHLQEYTTTADGAVIQEETLDEPEVEVHIDVFEPEFIESLMACKADKTMNGGMTLEIIGMRGEKCRLQYGNYRLNVPSTLLESIHSFDDLEILLRNKDITQYKYLPKFVYKGLIYALDSCGKHEKYLGTEEREFLPDAVVTRGLSAEYKDNICSIYLENILKMDLEDREDDYGYTCRLQQEAMDELMPYFKDIIAANPEPEDVDAEQPKDVRDADIALMYYLQQNDYCTKNVQSDIKEGEN